MDYKILIVEDEPKLREVLSDFFCSRGEHAFQARDGIEALALMEEQEFDAVLLDIMMPKLDGLSVCRAVRKNNDVPIALMPKTTPQGSTPALRDYIHFKTEKRPARF